MKMYLRIFNSIFIFFLCLVPFSLLIAQSGEEKLPAIVKRIEPSTVVILTYDKEGKLIGQGSGFFISPKGDVITNRHVLMDAVRAEVKTAKGKVYPITSVVAEDKEYDLILVLINIPQEEVKPLAVSQSVPEVGEHIIVIGNPLGLERTVADGIISAVREVPNLGKIIQITAPISPGSSGSPVVNMKGEVIGVATFQLIEGQNLNFAIPGERVAKLKPDKGKTFSEWQSQTKGEWLTSAEGLYSTGLIFLWAENYEEALPYFEKAVKKDPSYADAYFQIGYCNGELGRYTEAIEAYKQAIRINPDLAEAHNNLGVAYTKLERYTEAIEAYKQAIRIKPDYAEAHCNLGLAYTKLGRYTEAIEALKQAIRINPDLAETHCNLGVTYDKLGRYTEAIEAFKQAIRINPDLAEAHNNLGVAYGKLERYTEAIEAYKQAIRINPDYAEAHFGLGLVYLLLGDKGSALEEYKILKNLDKNLANELFNLIYQ